MPRPTFRLCGRRAIIRTPVSSSGTERCHASASPTTAAASASSRLSGGLYGYVFGAQRGISYNRNALQSATFTWHDLNGDKLYQPGEVNLNLNGADFVSVNGAIGNIMNPDLKQPLYQEYATS